VDTVPVQQDQILKTQYMGTGGQNGKPAGSGTILDQVFGYLSGIF